MLVKLTCRGRDFPTAVRRARRALAEFRIRGVSTNIPFLQALLEEPDFQAGRLSTSFIDERPALRTARTPGRPRHQAAHLPRRRHGQPAARPRRAPGSSPRSKLPAIDRSTPPPPGRPRPAPAARARRPSPRQLRAQEAVAVTETTFRDAHQSLLATRVRTRDLMHVAPHVARLTPQLLSVEAWGGATYDVALRFLAEDPWDRLAALREAMPNLPLQMLLRGRNTVGYTPYPTEVTDAFVTRGGPHRASTSSASSTPSTTSSQMRPAIEAVRATGTAVAEVALCYTGDLTSPGEKLYTLDYYLRLAEQIADAGAHVLAIKDMAGLLRAPAARTLVTALRERFDQPVHLHTHDTAGGQLATLLAAIDAGVDAVDVACAAMAGTTSPAAHVGLVAATDGTDARHRARPRRPSTTSSPTGRPSGSSTSRSSPGCPPPPVGSTPRDPRWPAVQPAPAGHRPRARRPLRGDRGHVCRGQPHPRQHRQGHAEQQGRRRPRAGPGRRRRPTRPTSRPTPRSTTSPTPSSASSSGELGDPPGGWPEPFRTKALEGRTRQAARHRARRRQDRRRCRPTPGRTLNRLLFPGPTKRVREVARRLLRPGRPGHPRVPARARGRVRARDRPRARQAPAARSPVGVDADDRGMRTVMFTIGGQLRPVQVRDERIAVDVKAAEKADPSAKGQVAGTLRRRGEPGRRGGRPASRPARSWPPSRR